MFERLKSMFGKDKILTPYEIARGEIGISEKGAPDRVLEYHSVTTLKAKEVSVAWCSSFICWCFQMGNQVNPKNTWARSWLLKGKPIKLEEAREGDLVIFTRGTASGHVGFFVRLEEDGILVLGGNQGDSVCEAVYPLERLLGVRRFSWNEPLV